MPCTDCMTRMRRIVEGMMLESYQQAPASTCFCSAMPCYTNGACQHDGSRDCSHHALIPDFQQRLASAHDVHMHMHMNI